MKERHRVASYTIRGTPERIAKLEHLIGEALKSAVPTINPGGPVEDPWSQTGGWVLDIGDKWPQSGGWYLVVSDETPVKVSQPDPSLMNVTSTVYQALSRAEQEL
ncbi:MAG TPA: hypothetical protein VE195_05840 [Acidobacteriaceae bacterium]|nr:hypothetical protein [Acidobacteriaceae bacterium]